MDNTLSHEYAQYVRGLQRMMDQERKLKVRTVFVSSRSLERNIDPMQLTVGTVYRARIQGTEPGTTIADRGKFMFVLGYSTPGGPDIMLP